MEEAPTKPREVARVKVRLLRVAVSATVLTAAGLLAAVPTAREQRTLAIVHLHPSVLHTPPAGTPLLRATPPDAAPGPASVPLPRPKARSLRPILPWWFHRRHIAAPQSQLQLA